MDETYIGDGLYASFDGFHFCLRAPRVEGDYVIYLGPTVAVNFTAYAQQQHAAQLERLKLAGVDTDLEKAGQKLNAQLLE